MSIAVLFVNFRRRLLEGAALQASCSQPIELLRRERCSGKCAARGRSPVEESRSSNPGKELSRRHRNDGSFLSSIFDRLEITTIARAAVSPWRNSDDSSSRALVSSRIETADFHGKWQKNDFTACKSRKGSENRSGASSKPPPLHQ